MMKRSLGVALMIAMAVSLFAVVGLYAGTTVPDVIEMNSPYEHTKSLVKFSHKKHATEYKATCGDCHHDDKGQPLMDLKEGDSVKKCFECHNKPGELKGKKAKGLSKEEKRMYHANAVHDNCRGCHRAYNKDNKTKAAPTKCTDCHPKAKK
jgi:cytochrome c553